MRKNQVIVQKVTNDRSLFMSFKFNFILDFIIESLRVSFGSIWTSTKELSFTSLIYKLLFHLLFFQTCRSNSLSCSLTGSCQRFLLHFRSIIFKLLNTIFKYLKKVIMFVVLTRLNLSTSMFKNYTFTLIRINWLLNIDIIIVVINLHMLFCFVNSFLIRTNLLLISF